MAAQQYWHANHWHANHWAGEFWATDPGTDRVGTLAGTVGLDTPESNLWAVNYWAADYWSSSYWGGRANVTRFLGEFDVAGTRTGTIAQVLEDLDPTITGPVVQVVYFDIDVDIAVPWVTQEFEAYSGSMAVTLGTDTSTFTGTFTAAGARIGTIAVTLADNTSNFDGTSVDPASRTGTISATLGNGQADFDGAVFGIGSALGTMATTLDGETMTMSGTYSSGASTGTIGATLDAYAAVFQGLSLPAGAKLGTMSAQLDDATSTVSGTFSAPGRPDARRVRLSRQQRTRHVKRAGRRRFNSG